METYDTIYSSFDASFLSTLLWLCLIFGLIYVVGMWKLYKKAGVPGWGSIVPFYNQYLLSKITLGSGWFFLLLLIPIVNVVLMVLIWLQLANSFGKGIGYGLGLIFLPFIFILILAFGKSEYQGVQK